MTSVLVHLPNHFCVRNVVYTPVLTHMGERSDVRWVLVSPKREDGEAIRGRGLPNVVHELTYRDPDAPHLDRFVEKGQNALRRRRLWEVWDAYDAEYLYDSLCYRHQHLHDLASLRLRRQMSRRQQDLERIYSNFVPAELGEPDPDSVNTYRELYQRRHDREQMSRHPWLDHLFNVYEPDAVLVTRLQLRESWPAMQSARLRDTPIVGVIQSWDQATTKGVIPPGPNVYAVGSVEMVRHLKRYHAIPRRRIANLGHVWLDDYATERRIEPRDAFLQRLGFAADHRLLLFCTNLLTMKAHEVSIARHLVEQLKAGAYGERVSMLIRTHPQDHTWADDFGKLHDPAAGIRVQPASAFGYTPGSRERAAQDQRPSGEQDLADLANLMKHADALINTRSTVSLDAIAFDTPVICLGFDGDLDVPAEDSVARRYAFEFFRPLIDRGAVWLARSYADLDEAVTHYLTDPSCDAKGRAAARRDHLEPYDGRASQRLVETCVRAATGKLPPWQRRGHWRARGLGRRLP